MTPKVSESLSEISQILTASAAAQIATSFCYRAGFFIAIDWRLLQFLSLTDIIPSASYSVGWIMLTFFLGYLFQHILTANSDIQAAETTVVKRIHAIGFKIVGFMAVLLLVATPFVPKPFQAFFCFRAWISGLCPFQNFKYNL
jgi:hypothetical protein